MPTYCDETLHDRYAREHADHLARLAKMTPEQIAEMELSLHNALAEVDRLRAQACQGGEAVEVVGWLGGNGIHAERQDATGAPFPLMTVAQHQRILAASVGSAEPVAYAAFADNGNIRMWCRSAIGVCELFDAHGNKAVPLYTHPADQVAQPDAELVELLRDARELIEHGDFREGHCMCGSAVEAHGFGDGHSPVDAGVYYAGQVMERIDAKLASLEVKP